MVQCCHTENVFTACKVSKYGVFSGPYFPAFELNTEIYGLNTIKCEKIRTRKNSVFGHFSRSDCSKQRSSTCVFVGRSSITFSFVCHKRVFRGWENDRERFFSYKLSSARIVIESAFGRLKGRFGCLKRTIF